VHSFFRSFAAAAIIYPRTAALECAAVYRGKFGESGEGVVSACRAAQRVESQDFNCSEIECAPRAQSIQR
jgi:hypothetical protein